MGLRSGDVGGSKPKSRGGKDEGSLLNSPFARFVQPLRDVCYLACGDLHAIQSKMLVKMKTLAKLVEFIRATDDQVPAGEGGLVIAVNVTTV